MSLPFVSIIIPVYNGEKTIDKCIKSVLKQKYPKDKYEVIIVDNNSKDKTVGLIKKNPVKLLRERNVQTSYAARNRGVRNAKGEIIAFTDSDCIVDKDWIRNAIRGFINNKIGCVAGKIKSYKPSNYVEEFLAKKNHLSPSSELGMFYPKTANAFYRKEVFDRIGFFEQRLVSGGDADFAWRMQIETDYKVKYAPKVIVLHRDRSDIKSLFKQSLKWGFGSVLLYKKYKDKMEKRTLKQNLWALKRIFLVTPKILIFLISKKGNIPKERKEECLDLISLVGWELGKIIGRLK